jgi:hypothetical protein
MKKLPVPKFFLLIAGVGDTGELPFILNIFPMSLNRVFKGKWKPDL